MGFIQPISIYHNSLDSHNTFDPNSPASLFDSRVSPAPGGSRLARSFAALIAPSTDASVTPVAAQSSTPATASATAPSTAHSIASSSSHLPTPSLPISPLLSGTGPGTQDFLFNTLEPNGIFVEDHDLEYDQWMSLASTLGIRAADDAKPSAEATKLADRMTRRKNMTQKQMLDTIIPHINNLVKLHVGLEIRRSSKLHSEAVPNIVSQHEEDQGECHAVPIPRPDITIGYAESNFSEHQRELQSGIISNLMGDPCDFEKVSQACPGLFWPFLVVETNPTSLKAAQHISAASAATLNNAVRMLEIAAHRDQTHTPFTSGFKITSSPRLFQSPAYPGGSGLPNSARNIRLPTSPGKFGLPVSPRSNLCRTSTPDQANSTPRQVTTRQATPPTSQPTLPCHPATVLSSPALPQDFPTRSFSISLYPPSRTATLSLHTFAASNNQPHIVAPIKTYDLKSETDIAALTDRLNGILSWGTNSRLNMIHEMLRKFDVRMNGAESGTSTTQYKDVASGSLSAGTPPTRTHHMSDSQSSSFSLSSTRSSRPYLSMVSTFPASISEPRSTTPSDNTAQVVSLSSGSHYVYEEPRAQFFDVKLPPKAEHFERTLQTQEKTTITTKEKGKGTNLNKMKSLFSNLSRKGGSNPEVMI